MKQFFYTRIFKDQNGTETPFLDSFNPDFVIQSHGMPDDKRLVVINNYHEEMREVPDIDPKTRKFTGQYKKERNTYSSEFELSKEDSERFIKLTNLE